MLRIKKATHLNVTQKIVKRVIVMILNLNGFFVIVCV